MGEFNKQVSDQKKNTMRKTFTETEDWNLVFKSNITSPCWLQILRIIDEFDQVVESEKKQITDWISDLSAGRIKLVKQFNKYKNSLQYQGQLKNQDILIIPNESIKFFFSGYCGQIEQIVRKIAANPIIFAKIIASNTNQKLDSQVFTQNILYHLYPCYMPNMINATTQNNCLLFIQQIIKQWNYDISWCRPKQYSIIDQIINGLNKTPQTMSYIQKISIVFMKQISKCKMNALAFDEQAIKKQILAKQQASIPQIQPKNKNFFEKFKGLFHKKQSVIESFCQTNPDPSEATIMQTRQKQFTNVIIKTIQAILNTQMPLLLHQMMKFFHHKIKKIFQEQGDEHKSNLKDSFIQQQASNSSSITGDNENEQQEQQAIQAAKKKRRYYIHYCYFLMTNLICAQLHKKFTSNVISILVWHADTGITPEMFQNYTEVVTIITQIFQGKPPKQSKYKDEQLKNLRSYIPNICAFYGNFANQFQDKTQKVEDTLRSSDESKQIRQILLKLHQNTVILSFGDIRTLLSIINSSTSTKQLQLSQKTQKMEFLKDTKISNMFSPATKVVMYQSKNYGDEKILFMFDSHQPSIQSVIQYYISNDCPLKNMGKVTEFLKYSKNQMMFAKNLEVSQAFAAMTSLHLISSLSLKQVKYFLNKMVTRFDSTLFLQDNQQLTTKFQKTIQENLRRKTERKSLLLMHRGEISSRMTSVCKLIQLYIDDIRSSQLYDRVSETYIQTAKIKVFLRIQNDELKIYQNANQMKGINLQSLLVTDVQSKSKKSASQQYILRNSFKAFTTISELKQALGKNKITRLALTQGRRCEEFNEMFVNMCNFVIGQIDDFMKKREATQHLNKQKLTKTVISKIQDYLFQKGKKTQIAEEQEFNEVKKKVNVQNFFKKDKEEINADWGFLTNQSQQKFKLMTDQTSIMERIRHFEQMFKMIFITLGFSMQKSKISAEIMNPVIQYLILNSERAKHYECLYSMSTLKWNANSETIYNITMYQSSIHYICKQMSRSQLTEEGES